MTEVSFDVRHEQIQDMRRVVDSRVSFHDLKENLKGLALMKLTIKQKRELAELLGLTWYEKGRIESAMGNHTAAKILYRKALLEKDPLQKIRAIFNLGARYADLGDEKKANFYRGQILAMESEERWVQEQQVKVTLSLGALAYKRGDLEEAQNLREKTVQMKGGTTLIREEKTEALLYLGRLARHKGVLALADISFRKALRIPGETPRLKKLREAVNNELNEISQITN